MNRLLCCLLLLTGVLTLNGCVTETIHLQNLSVDGPLALPPVHVTADSAANSWHITPRFTANSERSMTGRVDGHTRVNARGVYQVDTIQNNGSISYSERDGVNTYTFEGENLAWTLPRYTLGLDFDYTLTNHLALSLGLSYSPGNPQEYWGGTVGLGYFFYNRGLGGRLEGGVIFQSRSYTVDYVHVVDPAFSQTSDVTFLRKTGRDMSTNIYTSLTVNSMRAEWLVNFFMQVSLSTQTLVDVTSPQSNGLEEMRVNHLSTFLSFSPGLYLNLTPSSRVILGLRLAHGMSIEDASHDFVPMPLIQLDFTF